MATKDDSPKPKKPETITLYQYMSWENAEKVFTKWALKATLPQHTNDPFEFRPSDDAEEEYPISDKTTCPFCILCFSTNHKSAALWGHYGNSHQGCCLEFKFPINILPETKPNTPAVGFLHRDKKNAWLFLEVEYTDERVNKANDFCERIPRDQLTKAKNALLALMATKDKSWEFEQERRLIPLITDADFAMQGMLFFKEPMKYLTGVYLGIKNPHSIHYARQFVRHCIIEARNMEIVEQSDNKTQTINFHQMEYHPTQFEAQPNTRKTLELHFKPATNSRQPHQM